MIVLSLGENQHYFGKYKLCGITPMITISWEVVSFKMQISSSGCLLSSLSMIITLILVMHPYQEYNTWGPL